MKRAPLLKRPQPKAVGRGTGRSPGSAVTQFKPGVSGNPNGQPRILVPARDLHYITELAAKGCRQKDVARGVGLDERTLVKCLNEQPEVREAFDQGRQQLHDSLVNKLVTMALKGNVAALIYSCKVLLGYRENDVPPDQRPIVNITLPGAAPTLEAWKRAAITVQPEKIGAD